jgi:hypothetical protein
MPMGNVRGVSRGGLTILTRSFAFSFIAHPLDDIIALQCICSSRNPNHKAPGFSVSLRRSLWFLKMRPGNVVSRREIILMSHKNGIPRNPTNAFNKYASTNAAAYRVSFLQISHLLYHQYTLKSIPQRKRGVSNSYLQIQETRNIVVGHSTQCGRLYMALLM